MPTTPTTLEIAIEIAAGAALLFAVAILVYTLGSFLLMRPHTTARAMGISMRELARETFLAGITQPFLPFYYLLGYRMEPLLGRRSLGARSPRSSSSTKSRSSSATSGQRQHIPVIFVHGYMQNRVGFLGLARALALRGIGPLYGFNYPWFASIGSNAKRLERFIDRVREESKSAAVDLVCHSMGGLVAMEMMMHNEAQLLVAASASPTSEETVVRKVRRCVTIATPHAGVMWNGPMIGFGAASLRRGSKLLEAHATFAPPVPTLSLFSSHDNVVHPKETAHLVKRGGRDVEVEGFAHLSILFSSAVAEHVASFLSEPEPEPEPEPVLGEAHAPQKQEIEAIVAADVRGNGTAAGRDEQSGAEEAGHDRAQSRERDDSESEREPERERQRER